MAAVSAFVDDVVRGRLPLVCAKTGEPADLVIRMRQPVGSGLRSWAWLLVFFGPPGWLALLVVLMVAPAGEYLTVRIPTAVPPTTTRSSSDVSSWPPSVSS